MTVMLSSSCCGLLSLFSVYLLARITRSVFPRTEPGYDLYLVNDLFRWQQHRGSKWNQKGYLQVMLIKENTLDVPTAAVNLP